MIIMEYLKLHPFDLEKYILQARKSQNFTHKKHTLECTNIQ